MEQPGPGRHVIAWAIGRLRELGFTVVEHRADGYCTVGIGDGRVVTAAREVLPALVDRLEVLLGDDSGRGAEPA